MRRFATQIKLGDDSVKYRTRVEDDPSEPGHGAIVRQQIFLRALADQPDLLNCGYERFQRLIIVHSGSCWVAEAEAVVGKP